MKEINISDKKEEIKKEEPLKQKTEEVKNQPVKEDKKKIKEESPATKKIENLKGIISKKKGIVILSIIILIFILGIEAFYYFGIYKYNPTLKDQDVVDVGSNYITAEEETVVFAQLLVDSPEEPRTEESPLNGLLFTKSEMEELMTKRFAAVMISNHSAARPVSGITSTDLVIESLAESGITRYIAFFWSEAPEKVGSVRSTRQYFLEWISPYDPIYIHVGCADTNDPRTDACDHLFTYNIKDISYIGSWRWNDGRRYAPHNAYSSVISSWDYAEQQGWDDFPEDFESWQFKNDADTESRGDAYRYSIKFHTQLSNGGLYDTIWEYDEVTNQYKRWVGGKPDVDQENDEQVTAKVIVVQEVSMTSAYDNKGRIIIDTIGEGDAVILMDGEEIYGSWEKTDRMDRTTYYDEDENEIKFNRGRIWIAAIPQSVGEFDIIEQ